MQKGLGVKGPDVDEAALVQGGVDACEQLAAVPPFWR